MRRVLLAFSVIFFAIQTGYVNGGEAGAPHRAWDQIVTKEFFSDIANFSLAIEQGNSERIYAYSFSDTQDKLIISVAVMVGPAGKRLNPDAWKAAEAASDEENRARNFPKIRLRAQVTAQQFSPVGALSTIDFTTKDDLFDVRVSVFEASSTEPLGSLEAIGAARRVEQAYNATFQ